MNSLVTYCAYNVEKVLLGRFWGADALGLYGKAIDLATMPTDNINTLTREIGFSALSRIQDDSERIRSFFLKGYSLVLTMTFPITLSCALFAEDMILVLLGGKWLAAVPIFRLLSY